MKQMTFMLLILFSSSAVQAQAIPQENLPQQQQASVEPYHKQPVYPPQLEYAPPQATPPATQPRPWEYGQSVVTDIRQMNF